jgi:hypothetical protein
LTVTFHPAPGRERTSEGNQFDRFGAGCFRLGKNLVAGYDEWFVIFTPEIGKR